jgi:mRNA-degrading endonuclease RelE of RelBE toxin-antitoxin system
VIIWHCQNDLIKLESNIRKRIIQKLRNIEQTPFRYVEKIVDCPFYKLRIGDYRAILDIKKDIHVIMVAHRSVVYKKL